MAGIGRPLIAAQHGADARHHDMRSQPANGMIHTMTITMDTAGRLVIPREIRREAALEPGIPLDVRLRDGVIEIEPQALTVRLKRKGRLLVASPAARVSPLRTAMVERTRLDLVTRRGRR